MEDLLLFEETGNCYRSVIMDECGYVVKWLTDFDDEEEVDEWLNDHPEHRLTCVPI